MKQYVNRTLIRIIPTLHEDKITTKTKIEELEYALHLARTENQELKSALSTHEKNYINVAMEAKRIAEFLLSPKRTIH